MSLRVVLLYPPHQSWPGTMVKPNGSLAYPMLGGALLEMGIDVRVVDAAVGTENDVLEDVFFKSTPLPSGLLRTGISDERILQEVADADIVGLTSIFSDQETMVLHCAKLIKQAYPEKLILSGGANARFRLEKFLTNGIDLVFLSEAEEPLKKLVRKVQRNDTDFSDMSSVAFLRDGKVCINPTLPSDVVSDLDLLPMPAWHLLPNERYWAVGRPHGGKAVHEIAGPLRYASMMTSLGCPFACSFCHIASETPESITGDIGRFRVKSDDRVMRELHMLKDLGVRQIFIEDDSMFGRRQRGMDLLRKVRSMGMDIINVNGVNLIHLFRKGKADREIIEVLVEAGFKEISLPFETANARIMKKYVSNKWDPINSDVEGLIRMCKEYGLSISGNYMIGYPDETREEIQNTVAMAKDHVAWGIDSVGFMLVIPLPGTPIFQMALDGGYLPADWDIDRMNWQRANMINTAVPPEELEELRQTAWVELNSKLYQDIKRAQTAVTT